MYIYIYIIEYSRFQSAQHALRTKNKIIWKFKGLLKIRPLNYFNNVEKQEHVSNRISYSLKIQITKECKIGRKMEKKVHEKRSSSEMLPQSFPHPRISMVSSTSLRKAFHHSGGEKRKSEIWRTCKKSFLVHDDEYNSMIYEWRKLTTAPIVKVFMVSKDHDIDGRTGEIVIRNVVRVEKIVKRLTDISELSVGQSLYILRSMLRGHESIFKKLGATTISLEKCGLNQGGELKVWINQNFIRNEMSGEVLCLQPRIVSRIFEIIDMLSGTKLKNFRHYVLRNVEVSNWSFALMDQIIGQYVKSLRIRLPTTVRGLSGICTMKLLPSEMEREQFNQKFTSSLQSSPRENPNIQSSLNFSIKSPYQSQQNPVRIRSQIYDAPPQWKKSCVSTKLTDSRVESNVFRKDIRFIGNIDIPKLSIGEMEREQESEGFLTERKDKFGIHQQYNYMIAPSTQNPAPAEQFSFHDDSSKSQFCQKAQNYPAKHSEISTQNPSSNYGSRFLKLGMSNTETVKQEHPKHTLNKSPTNQINVKINLHETFGKSCIKQIQSTFPQLLQQFQSYQNTEQNSSEREEEGSNNSNSGSIKNTATMKKELLNKQVLISTYLEHSEQKKPENPLPSRRPRVSCWKQEELYELEEALNNLMASQKQREVLQHNSWTKKIDGLFCHEVKQLKESVSYELGQENMKHRKLGKLAKLGKWGRDVCESQIPE